MAAVRLDQVSKRFGAVQALSGVSLDIADGELMVLVGPSGCGKTTLLRSIAGLEEPDAGEIAIGGRRVDGVPAHRRNVAMVFQSYALYPNLTVFENIAFPLRARRVAAADVVARVRAAAERVGLAELLQRRPGQLSGGQRQRVAIARAIVREPDVCLMDEPLSGLDAQLRTRTRAELARLQRRLGTTTVVVTHDQIEAMTMGDRIAVMDGGRIQQAGAPADIYRRPANTFVAGFLGSPPMNLVPAAASTRDGQAGLALDQGGWLPLPHAVPQEVILGVRPEDLRLVPAGQGQIGGRVDLVEYLGAETLVTVAAGSRGWMVRLSGQADVRPDEAVDLAAPYGAFHLFDAGTTGYLGTLEQPPAGGRVAV